MSDHFIVVGGNALAHRLTVELTAQYEVHASAIVPEQQTPHTVQIAKVLGTRDTVVDNTVTEEALRRAGIERARAIAFVDGDDRTNIHAAMRAAALRPGIRIVIRMFNQRLGRHIAQLVADCTVLSASATAAPAFVNAALERPHSVTAGGRTLWIARGPDIDMRQTPFLIADDYENTATGRAVRTRQPSAGLRGHVVVVGLGNAGTRVTTLFREIGVPVVGIERDPQARGIAAARGLDVPVVTGDRPIDDALRRAQIGRARAVVAATGDDVANLEAALEARAINPQVRVVVRLFDDDFASHVYKEFGNTASRSVSYLAAPAFAAAMMGREVLGTLSVLRHVLLIAEVAVEAGSDLVGLALRELDRPGLTRVLAVRRLGSGAFDWSGADRGRVLVAGDAVIVAATRAGFGGLLPRTV